MTRSRHEYCPAVRVIGRQRLGNLMPRRPRKAVIITGAIEYSGGRVVFVKYIEEEYPAGVAFDQSGWIRPTLPGDALLDRLRGPPG